MKRQTIIVMISPNEAPVVRGNFKKLCDDFNLPFHTLTRLKMPIEYKDLKIYRIRLE